MLYCFVKPIIIRFSYILLLLGDSMESNEVVIDVVAPTGAGIHGFWWVIIGLVLLLLPKKRRG